MSISDKEYYQLTMSISKALNSAEMPMKSKHIRATIIGTFHTKGGHAFWAIATRQPLQENRITVYKFCHLLHKILREGHPHCLQNSMRHRNMLNELGKLWGHLNDGYGLSIKHYTKLLVTKLEFHDRNPQFPGSLVLKRGHLEKIGGNNNDFYFQMAVEMFDYLDDIIALQATIFSSLTTFCVSSMTLPGQCRLAPLIPLIQDSNQLYDFIVRIMFRLHANLPADILTGHRERFRAVFTQLSSFYAQSKNLQYFHNLITVPKLPETQPNFMQQSDLGNYTAPVVVMPESDTFSESDLVEENLVDMAMPTEDQQPPPVPELPARHRSPPPPDFDKLLTERDNLIRHLQKTKSDMEMEVERLTVYIKSTLHQQRENQARLESNMANLTQELTEARGEVANLRIVKEELELKADAAPSLEQKAIAVEEKAKASEEKFQKLKAMYTQIRDDHIKLIRQHDQVSKQLAASTKLIAEANRSKEELKCQVEEMEAQQLKAEETLQKCSEDDKAEKDALALKLNDMQTEYSVLQAKFDEMEANKSAELAELKVGLDVLGAELQETKDKMGAEKLRLEEECDAVQKAKDELETKYMELTGTIGGLENQNQEQKAERDALHENMQTQREQNEELKSRIEVLESEQTELRDRCSTLTVEQNQLTGQLAEQRAQNAELNDQLSAFSTEKVTLEAKEQELTTKLEDTQQEFTVKCAELAELKGQFEALEEQYNTLNSNMDRMTNEKCSIESDFQDLLHQQDEVQEKYQMACLESKHLADQLSEARIHGEAALRSLLEACFKSSEKLALRAISDNDRLASGTPTYFLMIAEEVKDILTKLELVHASYLNDNSQNVESLARKVIIGGHLLATAHVQGLAVCNSSADIECGERIAEEIKYFGNSISALFTSLNTMSESGSVKDRIADVRAKLEKVSAMVGDLSKKTDSSEPLGDLVERELAQMDKAIEAAGAKIAEMLSQSRASDSGIKLEVNEKILESCTTLMQCIRILVQKAKVLQAEIVALGKGTASAKEFYKRNHQWTEGLISAAKAVATGANLLVSAANKTVSGESKHQLDLIVAAQEIAASTAQLVVASRVKAPRNSQNLNALGQASKNVTMATGTVVATAKNCSERLEDSQDMDLTKLTIHQAKTREMEIQVKVLELEQALQVERMKLSSLRRKNYQAAE